MDKKKEIRLFLAKTVFYFIIILILLYLYFLQSYWRSTLYL